MQGFEQWSMTNLGQWHYILGYLTILFVHNWPLLFSLGLCGYWGWKLYMRPNKAHVCWFFGALFLGLAYEYRKHVALELHKAVDFLAIGELFFLNASAHILVGPIFTAFVSLLGPVFIVQAFWIQAGLTPFKRLRSRVMSEHR